MYVCICMYVNHAHHIPMEQCLKTWLSFPGDREQFWLYNIYSKRKLSFFSTLNSNASPKANVFVM